MADLVLKNITKRYPDGIEAVKNFNLEIQDKEFIILVGPSGCGKSTILRMIAGLEDISEGELYIDGKIMNDIPSKDRDIAMVFQNYALYPHMNVYDNMAFGLKLQKLSEEEIDRRVIEAANVLGIESLLDKKPKSLSGGQRQRVAMGRAMVRQPKVFLMDEPLSNLDAKLRVQLRTEISRIHQRLQTTFIYVTHNQIEAMTLGTRIVVFNDGIIQQVDSPQALYSKPINKFVAGFIGSPQMNFIDCLAEKTGEDVYLKFADYRFKISELRAKALIDGGYIGKEVCLGIRPEDIHDDESYIKKSPETVLKADVEFTEPLGYEAYLHLDVSGHKITARVEPGFKAEEGVPIDVALDMNSIHIFDKETEMTIVN